MISVDGGKILRFASGHLNVSEQTCTVNYKNGAKASLSVTIKRDATPPTITRGGSAFGPLTDSSNRREIVLDIKLFTE